MKLKFKTFFKQKLSMFTALTVALAGIPVGSIYAADVSKVQATGNSVINKQSSVYYDENSSRDYSLDEYMSNKDRIDAENTYTISTEYKMRESLTVVGTDNVSITIISVFPEFSGKTSLQVHQGTTVNMYYIRQSDTMHFNAHSALKGDLSGVHTEEYSMSFYSATYPGGVTQYNQLGIDTSLFGDCEFFIAILYLFWIIRKKQKRGKSKKSISIFVKIVYNNHI